MAIVVTCTHCARLHTAAADTGIPENCDGCDRPLGCWSCGAETPAGMLLCEDCAVAVSVEDGQAVDA